MKLKIKKKEWILIIYIINILLLPTMKSYAIENKEINISNVGISEEIQPTELDLGDCPSEIIIGTSQMLSVLVIPANSTNVILTYESSDPTVVSVNALGRITGNQLGVAEITIRCGMVENKFTVTVVEDNSQEKVVEVRDIEIRSYEEKLNVDSIMTLFVNVIPSDATDATVTYRSSNDEIATVNSVGEVRGISPGQVVIYVSAGNVIKQISITVKIETTSIELNSNYKIMKSGDTFQITTRVLPIGAIKDITYKSLDAKIATVSDAGIITAKACGNTSIIVSNGDLQASITVIVNEDKTSIEGGNIGLQEGSMLSKVFPEEVTTEEYAIISSNMLRYFYQTKKILTIKGDKYTIYIDGNDIVNYENELQTELLFEEEDGGFSFTINNENKLCGKIAIDINEKIINEKYLYLYNNQKEKYEKLAVQNINMLYIDTEGIYLLTSKPLNQSNINIKLIIIGGIIISILILVYTVMKRKYWFW